MSDPTPPLPIKSHARGMVLGLLALAAVGSFGMFVWQILPLATSSGDRMAAQVQPPVGPGAPATAGAPATEVPSPPAPAGLSTVAPSRQASSTPGSSIQTLPDRGLANPTGSAPAPASGAAAALAGLATAPAVLRKGVAPAVPGLTPPSFDVVRIAPSGTAVIAGRSAPDADVSVRADGIEVGHTTADRQGAWAMVLAQPLPPGPHVLTLREHTAGGQELASAGSVLMAVPGQGPSPGQGPAAPQPPLAVLTAPQLPPRVLQGPPGDASSKPGQLGLGALDYDAHGDLRLSGTAHPDTTVRLYADNHPIGDARTGKDGTWSAAPGAAVTEGTHQLRLDQIGPDGKVSARVTLPFRREVVQPGELTADRVVVQPGASLWRIAARAYGEGMRYTVIYAANREQISNPDLIYPGQVFAMPAGGAAASDGRVMPVSSSTSR